MQQVKRQLSPLFCLHPREGPKLTERHVIHCQVAMSTVRKVTNRRESDAVAILDSQVREGLPEQLTFGSRDLKEGAGQENNQEQSFRQRNTGPNSRERPLGWESGGWWAQRGSLGLDCVLSCSSSVDSGFCSKCNRSQKRTWGVIKNQTDFGFNLKADSGCHIGNRLWDAKVEAGGQLEAGGDRRWQGPAVKRDVVRFRGWLKGSFLRAHLVLELPSEALGAVKWVEFYTNRGFSSLVVFRFWNQTMLWGLAPWGEKRNKYCESKDFPRWRCRD